MVDQLSLVATAAKGSIKAKVAGPDPLKGGDVYKWARDQAAHIRAGHFDKIDRINVADEIEGVGKSEFRSLASHLEIILLHMLKWDFQQRKRSRSWINSIDEHHERVIFDLRDSPSLTSRLDEAVGQGYRLARYGAAKETRLALESFPETCPYSWDDIAKRPFVWARTDQPS